MLNGRPASLARTSFGAASGRYANVQMYDAADNLLNERAVDDCDDDFETRNPHLSAQHSEQMHRGMQ